MVKRLNKKNSNVARNNFGINDSELDSILKDALRRRGLDLQAVSKLLNIQDNKQIKKIFKTAAKIKMAIYGPRIVLFAPLYVSNHCVNDCAYCGFHRSNAEERKKLSLAELKKEVEILENMGHKRLLLEFGEDPVNNPIDYVVDVIRAIYSVKNGKGEIRRVNVNIAATTAENYRKLKNAGIGTYQLFQETYHKPTYKKLHNGPKADYNRQYTAHERAIKAGIDDYGMGVLFGLYDYKYEVLALLKHIRHLSKKFGIGPHTISVPRFCPAETVNFKSDYTVSDKDFLKIIAVLRLAVPYTGMIISTRETPEIRRQAFKIGISQASAGSRTTPGGYGKKDNSGQFFVSDHRNLDEVVYDICKNGYMPSFCTACYRSKRTGDAFMKLAKTGDIQNLCRPNAILTFKEYLEDYAKERTQALGHKMILNELEKIENREVRDETKNSIERIKNRERDLYF